VCPPFSFPHASEVVRTFAPCGGQPLNSDRPFSDHKAARWLAGTGVSESKTAKTTADAPINGK
jgi:hypothetical protein